MGSAQLQLNLAVIQDPQMLLKKPAEELLMKLLPAFLVHLG